MTNLSITGRCNRLCDYCFAREPLAADRLGASDMSLEVFEQALDFLIRSGIREARLLGGEPTLHPAFLQLMDRVLERGLRLLVFTGGLISAKVLERLEMIGEDRLAVLVNVVPPTEGQPAVMKRQAALFRRLGSRIILGMNITSPAVQLDFLLDLIDRYHLSRHIRLGLAHPVFGGANHYLYPRHYPEVGRRVTAFALDALNRDVKIEWDCGWVPCMFPKEGLSALGIVADDVGLRCNPILDVMPDGQVIPCYPLAILAHESLPKEQDASFLRALFTQILAKNGAFHLYKQCACCEWRMRATCTGGCTAAALRRVRHTDFTYPIMQSRHPGTANCQMVPADLASGKFP